MRTHIVSQVNKIKPKGKKRFQWLNQDGIITYSKYICLVGFGVWNPESGGEGNVVVIYQC